jgi:hypothetical protein
MPYELSEERKQYIEACEVLRKHQKALRKKHSSKVYKGFCKMCLRQDNKPSDVSITLPVMIKLPLKFKGEYTHCINVSNNKWNGMNLRVLTTQIFDRVGGYNSSFTINPLTGKYSLTNEGRKRLKKRK